LPELDGLDVLVKARTNGMTVPVLIITARDDVRDRVAGLDAGANDYLTKPFHLEELEARIRALLRKDRWGNQTIATCGSLSFDTSSRIATIGGKPRDLSMGELAINTNPNDKFYYQILTPDLTRLTGAALQQRDRRNKLIFRAQRRLVHLQWSCR